MADFNATLELTNAGNGLAALLNAITSPVASFLLALGIIGVLLYILRQVGNKIGGTIK